MCELRSGEALGLVPITRHRKSKHPATRTLMGKRCAIDAARGDRDRVKRNTLTHMVYSE